MSNVLPRFFSVHSVYAYTTHYAWRLSTAPVADEAVGLVAVATVPLRCGVHPEDNAVLLAV